jgi:hypothetical protein
MVRCFLIVLLILSSFFTKAQEENSVIRKGLLRAQLGFAHGTLLNYNSLNTANVGADLEYYLDRRFSIRSDVFLFVDFFNAGNNRVDFPFVFNHSLYTGAAYHFLNSKSFDPYIGLQPGFVYGKSNQDVILLASSGFKNESLNPAISGVIGFNYYAPKVFHLLFNIRYVKASIATQYNITPVDELRITLGLGFNLNTRKAD